MFLSCFAKVWRFGEAVEYWLWRVLEDFGRSVGVVAGDDLREIDQVPNKSGIRAKNLEYDFNKDGRESC